jgi:hypothetical protein
MAEGPRLRRPPPRARPGPRQRQSRRCARGRQLSAEAAARANIQARQTPSWPRSWANFSLFWLYSHRNTWANLHLLGQPDTFLAFIATPVSLTSLECQVSELVNRDVCPVPRQRIVRPRCVWGWLRDRRHKTSPTHSHPDQRMN